MCSLVRSKSMLLHSENTPECYSFAAKFTHCIVPYLRRVIPSSSDPAAPSTVRDRAYRHLETSISTCSNPVVCWLHEAFQGNAFTSTSFSPKELCLVFSNHASANLLLYLQTKFSWSSTAGCQIRLVSVCSEKVNIIIKAINNLAELTDLHQLNRNIWHKRVIIFFT